MAPFEIRSRHRKSHLNNNLPYQNLFECFLQHFPLESFFHDHKKPILRSWRMDETYVKVKGQWFYYRALDSQGNTSDFYLCERRDETAAKSFFEKKIKDRKLLLCLMDYNS